MKKMTIKDIDKKLITFFPNECLKTIEYQDMKSPIKIQCLSCGKIYESKRAENIFRKKKFCSKCTDTLEWRKTKEKFIKWIENSEEFELVDNLTKIHNSQQKIRCRCKKCGRIQENKKIYDYFANKHCYCQTKSIKKPNDILLKELGDDIELLESYVNTDTPLLIHNNRCNHTYKARLSHLLKNKNMCPICNSSTGEKEILYCLDKMGLSYIREFKINIGNQNMRIDFYLPEYNLMIEYNGIQHYQPVEHFGGAEKFNQQQKRDNKLLEYCECNNIKLLIIPYTEYNKIEKILKEVLPNES